MRKLLVRTVSGLLYVALIVFSACWSQPTFLIVLFVFLTLALIEFQNFVGVATGPCKHAGDLAAGKFSSLLHLLSFLCSLLSTLGPEMRPNRWQHGVETLCALLSFLSSLSSWFCEASVA